MTVIVWGGLDDPPVAAVLDALGEQGADAVHLDRETLAVLRYELAYDGAGALDGWIASGGRRIELASISGLFLRPQAQRTAQAGSACLLAVAAGLRGSCRVLNPPAAGRANLAKPVQLAAIEAAGFDVPPTLVTSDPAAARAFLERHGRIVYKSISGVRSIVAALEAGAQAARLDEPARGSGPVQLQRWIEGTDVRVHVVGRRCFATAIESAAVDYRYAESRLSAIELDGALAARAVALAQAMNLALAGIDLRRGPDGRWVCFEVNPAPGFTYYEDATGQPIAAAIAAHLSGSHVPA